jgi:alkylated DNA repair dioxygenase AlkB
MGQTAQLELLASDLVPIEGLAYHPDLVPPEMERDLVGRFAELEFKEFEFQRFLGKRRVVSFGVRYDFGDSKVHQAPHIPAFLHPLRELAAAVAGIEPLALRHALVTEYQPGAAIGWHRDRPAFKDVIGLSLLAPCRFRLRRKAGTVWQRYAIMLAARSAYLLRGAVREHWQHSITPQDQLRYSVTFRTLIDSEA